MFEPFLNSLFSPVLNLNPVVGEIIITIIIAFMLMVFNRVLINQKKLKELKEKQKELQKEAKKLQKIEPEQANLKLKESLKASNEIMKLNFKPMLPTLVIVVLLLPWLGATFGSSFVKLPFTLPYFGNDFGWLMWYFLVSIPFTAIFRKILGVQ